MSIMLLAVIQIDLLKLNEYDIVSNTMRNVVNFGYGAIDIYKIIE